MTITIAPLRAVLVALVAGAVIVAGVCWQARGDDRTSGGPRAVPYGDPQSGGLLTLCSDDGESVTGGGTADRPFAAAVLGQTALPPELDATGAVATLFAYQPREGVAADEYSGVAITAATRFAAAEQPAARITGDAWSVGDFVAAFPADFDGHVQLRLYLGTPETGTLSTNPYDTADLRVDGDRWELVRGGSASCADAESALVR